MIKMELIKRKNSISKALPAITITSTPFCEPKMLNKKVS